MPAQIVFITFSKDYLTVYDSLPCIGMWPGDKTVVGWFGFDLGKQFAIKEVLFYEAAGSKVKFSSRAIINIEIEAYD